MTSPVPISRRCVISARRCAVPRQRQSRSSPSATATPDAIFPASYANKIYLSPQGAVDLHGFATNNLYYKSLLDMLKVTTNIFRVGTYKSAVEPLIRDDMSPAAREADSRWIGGL